MTYKIIAGPTQMRVERYSFKSEPIDIGDEYVNRDNEKARDFYYDHMHDACKSYINLVWIVNGIKWNMIREAVDEILEEFSDLYFDGPNWIVSIVPWKEAKYGEWFMFSKRIRSVLKKKYLEKLKKSSNE